MALTTPTSADEVIDRVVNDVFLALQDFGANPSLQNSWLNALIVGYSNRVFDFYFALDQAALESLPDTATAASEGGNLERWAAIWGIVRIPGAVSSGIVVAGGTAGSTILEGATLTAGDGTEYTAVEEATITSKSGVPLALITSDGLGTATVVWIFNANNKSTPLVDGDLLTVTGAVESPYNVVDAPVTVLSATSFTYPIVGAPSSPATGAPVGAWTNGAFDVESVDFAEAADAEPFAALQFESPIVGVNEDAFANALGLSGGTDRETDVALRARLLDRIQNPVAHFNVADIEQQARTVPGVTRVFVLEITPAVGQVTVYFMRDLDETGAIPDGNEVQEVKDALDLIRPANTAPEDLIVLAPTPAPTDFTFTALVPNTDSMKAAVLNSLVEFFTLRTNLATDVNEDEYRSAIFNTVDTTNGQVVTSFSLQFPSGPIPVGAGEIATLGTVQGLV